jgi:hypothetical protein
MATSRDTRAPISPLHAPSVDGLDPGRKLARKQSARRRRKTAISRAVSFAIAAGAVGGAGYYGWQFYHEEQRKEAEVQPAPDLTPQEAIDKLETLQPWNGPGNPTFGVGEAPAQP